MRRDDDYYDEPPIGKGHTSDAEDADGGDAASANVENALARLRCQTKGKEAGKRPPAKPRARAGAKKAPSAAAVDGKRVKKAAKPDNPFGTFSFPDDSVADDDDDDGDM